jgi:hypothetical protein
LTLAALACPVPSGAVPGPEAGPVPYQFIAKGYTELLGRAPRPAEWRDAVALFTRRGCSVGSLRALGDRLVGSAEYRRDYPPGPAQDRAIVLTLFRFVLNREPDSAGFVAERDALASGRLAARAVADRLFSSQEFADITEPAVCSPTEPSDYAGQPGNWTGFPALPTPVTGAPGPDAAETTLQAALWLRSLAGGGVVDLEPGQVTGLATTLVVPGNVTLTTAGDPDPDRYADMAELARLPSFAGLPGSSGLELVRLEPGAKLVHVWVDGQRDAPDPNNFLDFDVRTLGGAGTTVAHDRLSNTDGAGTLEVDSGDAGIPGATDCSHNVVADNLVEAYSSAHVVPPGEPDTDHPQADGIGVYCTHTTVEGNDLVDISDTAIVLFDGASLLPSTPPQRSLVADNTIVSAGNSSSFGIATDPSYSLSSGLSPGGDPPGTTSRAFSDGTSGARIVDNVLWSGDRTHFDVLLSSGTHDLFGSTVHQNCAIPDAQGQATCGGGRNATGATWTGNSSAGLLTEVEMGIYVGGTTRAVLEHNDFADLVEVRGGTCPKAPVVEAAGFAPGLRIDQPVHVDTALVSDNCVNPSF